jgi:hypothetical protein
MGISTTPAVTATVILGRRSLTFAGGKMCTIPIDGSKPAKGATRKVPAQPVSKPARIANGSLPVSAQRTEKYNAPTIAKSVGISDITV